MARLRGCDGNPAPKPVLTEELNGDIIEYYHCPSILIPRSVHHWYDQYAYHSEFTGADMVGWSKQTAKWLRFYRVYKNEVARITKELSKIHGGR